ncbi:MAG: RNA-binding domain-containing protein [Pseudobdellovibrionaceae bacterium]
MSAFFEQRESKHLELKEKLPTNLQIVKTCVAFANNGGGEIVLGVKNQTQEVVGVSTADRDFIFESLANSIFDSISPEVYPEIFEKNMDGQNVIYIKIYPGLKPPYFVKSEGTIKGVYLRVGSNTRRASQEYIDELLRAQKKITFDEQSSSCDFQDVDRNLLKAVYGPQMPTESKLLADRVICRDGRSGSRLKLTNTGILFFTPHPENYLPEAILICTEFKGTEGRDIYRTEELIGPIPQLVEKALQTLKTWLEKDFRVSRKGKLSGKIPVPMEALREAVINALIHRKYFIPGAVKIAVFENRLEIFSPGSFPGLVSVDNIGDGTTFLRNPHLARIGRYAGLVEKMGTGARLIFESCLKAHVKRPVYNEDGDFVKLTFFFEKELNPEKSVDDAILALFDENETIQISQVMRFLKISRNTATRRMNQLIQKNKVIRQGKGPSTVFLRR